MASDTPRVTFSCGMHAVEQAKGIAACPYCDLSAARAECEEQARLNGIGAERELALKAECERLRKDAEQHLKERDYLVSEYERAVGCSGEGFVHAALHLYNAITNAKINAAIAREGRG